MFKLCSFWTVLYLITIANKTDSEVILKASIDDIRKIVSNVFTSSVADKLTDIVYQFSDHVSNDPGDNNNEEIIKNSKVKRFKTATREPNKYTETTWNRDVVTYWQPDSEKTEKQNFDYGDEKYQTKSSMPNRIFEKSKYLSKIDYLEEQKNDKYEPMTHRHDMETTSYRPKSRNRKKSKKSRFGKTHSSSPVNEPLKVEDLIKSFRLTDIESPAILRENLDFGPNKEKVNFDMYSFDGPNPNKFLATSGPVGLVRPDGKRNKWKNNMADIIGNI